MLLGKTDALARQLSPDIEEEMYKGLARLLSPGAAPPTKLRRYAGLAATTELSAVAATALLRLQPDSVQAHLAAAAAAMPTSPLAAGEAQTATAACSHARRALELALAQRSDLEVVLAGSALVVLASLGAGVPPAEAQAAFDEGAAAVKRIEQQLPAAWVTAAVNSRAAASKALARLVAGRAAKPPRARALWGALNADAEVRLGWPRGSPTPAELLTDSSHIMQVLMERDSECAKCGRSSATVALMRCARCHTTYCRRGRR